MTLSITVKHTLLGKTMIKYDTQHNTKQHDPQHNIKQHDPRHNTEQQRHSE
jgi:hypothetical protein